MSQPESWPPPPPLDPPVSSQRRAAVVSALLVAAAVTVLGAPLGLLWAMIAPDVPIRVTERGPVYAEAQPEQLIAADGWFVLLAVPFGVLVAAGAWLAGRSARGTPGLVAVTFGAVVAALLAWWLGRQIGLTDYQADLAGAQPGADLGRPADLGIAQWDWWPPRITGVPLVPGMVAAAAYTLLAAWSRFPSLRPEPAYPAGGDGGGSPVPRLR